MRNFYVMPDTKSFETKETLAAYYGISAVELENSEGQDEVTKKACELIAIKRGYTLESLKQQDLKRTMLMLLAGNATIGNGNSFEPKFDINNKYIEKAMNFIGMNVEANYSWDELSKIEAEISFETMLIKVGLGIELDYFECIALDALSSSTVDKVSVDFLEDSELYTDDKESKETK